mgnify:FL=1
MLGGTEYRPAPTQFQGRLIDSSTNRQINKEHFPNLPLIQNLVDMFEKKFAELSVHQVWLIRKCSTESGFQGWHQDKVGHQTKTIVVNLGSSAGNPDYNHNPEFGKGKPCYELDNYGDSEQSHYSYRMAGAIKKRFVSYEQRLKRITVYPSDYASDTDKQQKPPPEGTELIDMQHTSSDEDDEETQETDASIRSEVRDQAMIKRNSRQAKQAQMHMKIAGMEATKSGVALGAIVKLNVDYRTHCHASALIEIVFGFKPETGGVTVCCDHGVITHDGSRNPYYVPVDKYAVIAKPNENIPISKELMASGTSRKI